MSVVSPFNGYQQALILNVRDESSHYVNNEVIPCLCMSANRLVGLCNEADAIGNTQPRAYHWNPRLSYKSRENNDVILGS